MVYEEGVLPRLPGRASANGTSMLAPTLFAHGSSGTTRPGAAQNGQRRRDLGPGVVGAGVRQRSGLPAVHRHPTDGGWLLNGQKIWSSRAPFGDRAFGLFRSDPTAERHRGLTYFMFDLKADGVTVRPIAQLGGDTGFGEVFLDNVFVPDHDVIGSVHDGWRAAMSTTSNERGMSLRSPARFVAPGRTAGRRMESQRFGPAHADRGPMPGSRPRPTGCTPSAPLPGFPRAGNWVRSRR